MGALTTLRAIFNRNPQGSIGSASARIVRPNYGKSGMSRPMMWAAYLKCFPVNAAINTIAETAVSKGYFFEDTKKDAPEDPVEKLKMEKAKRLIDEPGALQSGEDLLAGIILSLEIFGDAWLEVQYKVYRDALGRVMAKEPYKLYLLPPQEMFIVATEDGQIMGYVQRHKGKEIKFKPDDILHIAQNQGPGALYGTPKMVAVKNMIATWLRAIEYNHDYYFNHGRPKAIINLGSISQGELDRVINKITEDMEDEGGGYTFLNTPELTVAPLADSNKDMEYSQMLAYYESRILAEYAVPKLKIGISETGGAGMITGETQIGTFYDRIEALNRRIETAFNRFFQSTLGLERYKFRIRSPRPLVDPALVQSYGTLLDKKVLVPNEVRELLGLEPLEGGDVPIAAPQPLGVMMTSPLSPTPPPTPAAGASTSATYPNAPALSPIERSMDADKEPHPFNRPGEIYRYAVQIAAENTAEYVREIKAGIRRLYENALSIQRAEKKIVDPETFKADVQKIIDGATDNLIERSGQIGIDAWIEGEKSVLGRSITPDEVPKDILDAINNGYGAVPIKTFSQELAAKITEQIEQSVAQGDISLYKITSTLQDTVPDLVDAESWKLERIERTRFNRMVNTAGNNAMKRAGIRAYKRVGVRDGRQSDICRELDGKIFLVEDHEHLPPSHPNCRCVAVPLTDEQYKEALQRGEIQPMGVST